MFFNSHVVFQEGILFIVVCNLYLKRFVSKVSTFKKQTMKLSTSLLQVMLVAVAAGAIQSCKKPSADELKKKTEQKTNDNTTPRDCPACGMG